MRHQEKVAPDRGRVVMSNNRSTWLDWDILVKRTVARFARGNIAAQQGRILFPEEQARQRERVRDVTRKWKERALRALS